MERIYRILVWGCPAISDVHVVLNQDLQDFSSVMNGYFAHISVVKNSTCVFRKSGVLNQDLQDWKGFTGFWFGGALCFWV